MRTSETRLTVSREEEADRDLRHTAIIPPAALALVIAFLIIIATPPILQQIVEMGRIRALPAAAGSRRLPQVMDIFKIFPGWGQLRSIHGWRDAWDLIPPVKSIRNYETEMQQGSILSEWMLSGTESFLSGKLGLGNEQAYLGRGQWLFYRPDVDYLTDRPFLDPAVLRERRRSGGEDTAPVQPDPTDAILRLNGQLAARGIHLVVMPAPVKPVIEPEELADRYHRLSIPIQNPSYAEFLRRLRRAGVDIFDVQSVLAKRKRDTGDSQFLKTDTHWTPAAMEAAAAALASKLRGDLPATDAAGYRRTARSITNLGDIAVMLKLPKRQKLYETERVTVHPVMDSDGAVWRSAPDADVLILGDSFTNIYSLDGMNWGAGAGFAEQLSCDLERPVDKIAINAGGSYSSRQALVGDMARGHDRLAGKRVVIYEFAMRDLTSGDWKRLDLPKTGATGTGAQGTGAAETGAVGPNALSGHPTVTGTTSAVGTTSSIGPAPGSAIASNAGLVVEGTVKATASTPRPGSVPYKDCIIAVRLTGVHAVRGTIPAHDILVYTWGLKDNTLVAGTDFRVGQQVRMAVQPWEKVQDRLGSYNRRELDDPDALMLDAYWTPG